MTDNFNELFSLGYTDNHPNLSSFFGLNADAFPILALIKSILIIVKNPKLARNLVRCRYTNVRENFII